MPSAGKRSGRSRSVALIGALATAIIVGLCSSGSGRSQPSTLASGLALGVDHFSCYATKFSGFKTRTVRLRNQFGTISAQVGQPLRLCAPADKNGSGILHKEAHLTCYALARVDSPLATRRVEIRNQFGVQRLTVSLNPPESLCLPSSKGISGAPGRVPKLLDHYLCYRVDPAGTFRSRRVKLSDQFGAAADVVVRARTLCAPTSKNGSRILQARIHLSCYLLKSARKGRTVVVRNQFGLLKAAVGLRNLLCVPSTKRLLAQPATTSPLKQVSVEPQHSSEFPAFPVPQEEERNEDLARPVTLGPQVGSLTPSTKSTEPDKQSTPRFLRPDARAAVTIVRNTSFQSQVSFSGSPPDLSGADNGETVFVSGNTFGARSNSSGGSFSAVNPTTIFPSAATRDAAGQLLDNGLCCDQVIQYVPQIDRFIWLMQFCGAGSSCLQGRNRIRIASASTASVRAGATSWTYWDLLSSTFALDGTSNPNMDYPNLSVGTNFLYLSVDDVGSGLLVARIPLSEIAASTTIHIGYTTPSDSATAYGGHLTQNVGDTEYWAGHISNSKMRIFSVRESENVYRWRDVDVNSWCNGTRSSTTPGGSNDWLSFGFPGNAVLGSTQRINPGTRANELWFAWTAGHQLSNGRSCGFDQSHTEIVVLNATSFAKISQLQIWNPTIAFAYTDLASNSGGEIGLSLGYGGGSNEANHAIGFWGDFIVYSTTSSTTSNNRFGDYVTIRRSYPTTTRFSAEGYGVNARGFDPHYILFGR
jgi:hypothetical protein